ncbi:membrane AbrB-like protein [Peribacillus deserti]|uniref:Membrane AbrB-like protein n=1 Tax=Peribacillus deserti TaxID=673318 RepID=A0ABS2QDW8_9BACI|nr:AbrB family transcriptional regulator [Peribacillus deserti]MBM7691355.1 membrane AbrB-like protein [Peribacillus deserti]
MRNIQFATENYIYRFLYTLVIALAGGILFSLISLPIPWLLGPMAAVLIGSRFQKIKVFWPDYIRDTGLIVVGYLLGLSFSREAVIQISHKLPSMFLTTILLIAFCGLTAFSISKLTGIDYPTILIGSIPGGLSQMIAFAEEMKGINITIVAFFQVSRLILIISIVPLLIFSPLFSGHTNPLFQNTIPPNSLAPSHVIIFAAVSILCAFLGKKAKLPTPFLLGPMAGTAALILIGFKGIAVPGTLLNLSQFMIGAYVGLLLKPQMLEKKVQITFISILSGLILIAGSLGLSLLLIFLHDFSPATSYLSVAPGGMDQMGIIAHEVRADLSVVTGYQVFRIFFIYFIIPPLLRYIFRAFQKKKART